MKLALRRHVRGRSCQWWSGRRERFVGTHCHKSSSSRSGEPQLVVPAAARARAGPLRARREGVRRPPQPRREVRRGQEPRPCSRWCPASRGAPPRAPRAPRARAGDGGWQEGWSWRPMTVRARPTVVRASGRGCKVSGSTPLAALAGALAGSDRVAPCATSGAASGGSPAAPGSCSWTGSRASATAGRTAGSTRSTTSRATSAPRMSPGPAAQGRPRAVALLRARPREPQLPALAARRAGATAGPPGGSLRVRVFGYDNERTRRPWPARASRSGPASAVADATGTATLTLPSRAATRWRPALPARCLPSRCRTR